MATTIELTRDGYLVDGRLLPRVSTIIGEMAKPGLHSWQKKVGFEEAERVVKAAARFGDRLHAACEQVHHGVIWQPGPDDADLAPHLDAYQAWFAVEVASVELVEQPVYSLRLGYAGTLDVRLVLRDGRKMLCDAKSSKSLNEGMRLQTIAYDLALEEMGLGRSDGRAIIHLPSNRPGIVRFVEFGDSASDALTWRCLVQLYRWRQEHRAMWKESRA